MFEDEEEELTLTINRNFAEKYENRKRFEEFSQLKAKYGDEADEEEGSFDSESEEEDEVGELVTPEVDAQIMKTIATIRAGKPEVYDPKQQFFSEAEIEKARAKWKEKQKEVKQSGKPMRLKDYHRRQLLEGGDDEEGKPEVLTHAEEQDMIKRQFKSVIEADDDAEDDFLSIRPRSKDEQKREEEDYRRFLLENMAADGGQGLKDYRDYKAVKARDPEEAFLMEYILNRGWVDKEAQKIPSYNEVVGDVEDDEEAVEAAEEFERQHNFRFEEEGAFDIVTHARNIDGTIRRKDDKRKRQRDAKKARKETEDTKKAEELKRLKNLKKEEIRKRLEQIRQIAGGDVVGLNEVDLEKEFDPEEFDQKMAEAFNEGYYDREDGDIKPEFGDDIDISDIAPNAGAWSVEEGAEEDADEWVGEGNEEQTQQEGNEENFIMDADYLPGGEQYDGDQVEEPKGKSKKDKKSKKNKQSDNGKEGKMSLDQYLDEYYQLDYEDMIGDLPTRFKYRKVPAEDWGLKPLEVLEADDADLNELIGLKKLAPFRRQDLVEKDKAKWSKSRKKRLKEFRKKLSVKHPEREVHISGSEGKGHKKKGEESRQKRKRGEENGEVESTRDKSKKRTKPAKEDGEGGWYIDTKGISGDRLASYQMPKKK
ncbi:hypothetical protein SpCBS45565_g05866 [Spizellomyces sp. 'palustris']|nr:hypothetical protein SpCBS45565_g05866 [Spizellomyces sp. 'palustris']